MLLAQGDTRIGSLPCPKKRAVGRGGAAPRRVSGRLGRLGSRRPQPPELSGFRPGDGALPAVVPASTRKITPVPRPAASLARQATPSPPSQPDAAVCTGARWRRCPPPWGFIRSATIGV